MSNNKNVEQLKDKAADLGTDIKHQVKEVLCRSVFRLSSNFSVNFQYVFIRQSATDFR